MAINIWHWSKTEYEYSHMLNISVLMNQGKVITHVLETNAINLAGSDFWLICHANLVTVSSGIPNSGIDVNNVPFQARNRNACD